jgi:hypothetical protein
MTPAGRLLARAIILALLLLSIGAQLASADSGRFWAEAGPAHPQDALPEDPGFEY